jgi:hypothetical protein
MAGLLLSCACLPFDYFAGKKFILASFVYFKPVQ